MPIDHNQYRDIQLFHARRRIPVICAGARSVEMSQPRIDLPGLPTQLDREGVESCPTVGCSSASNVASTEQSGVRLAR